MFLKQATVGPCNIPQPSLLNFVAKAKRFVLSYVRVVLSSLMHISCRKAWMDLNDLSKVGSYERPSSLDSLSAPFTFRWKQWPSTLRWCEISWPVVCRKQARIRRPGMRWLPLSAAQSTKKRTMASLSHTLSFLLIAVSLFNQSDCRR